MKCTISVAYVIVVGLGLIAFCNTARAEDRPTADPKNVRSFTFHYETTIEPPTKDSGPIEIFVPLAETSALQEVVYKVDASVPGAVESESKFGNTFWHAHLASSDGVPITVAVTYQVKRFANRMLASSGSSTTDKNKELSPEMLAPFLTADTRVPVSGALIDSVKRDLPKNDGTPLGKARAIYDYVVKNMEYKKVGTGWGNGDTYWACSEKYGNCTDFHALFISLARSEGIPARFEIGFPIDDTKAKGDVGGYHCWALFYIAGRGWIPVDASEAKKHPEKQDLFFGNQPTDRIKISEGRDIVLGTAQVSKPLNYFVYPYVEVNGKPYGKLKNTFRFEDVAQGQ